jgi:methionyl-tRNA synthetase
VGRVFIGVAWPYANAQIHIGGFAGVYLPADIFARFHRLAGDEVLMVSGSDAHGTPILVAAEEQGSTPEAVFERFHRENQAVLQKLGIGFDLFTHTHTPVHERTVQELFLALLENGFIARRTDENPYCPNHARFLPDRYVVGTCPHCGSPTARGDECDRCGRVLEPRQLGSPKCRLCGHAAEFRPSEHFFLLLDKLAPRLEAYLSDKTYWRDSVVGVTRNFLTIGLHPTSITRDLDWGVPIPLEGYGSKRLYVWFDALVGYLSASREWAIRSGHPDAWRPFWDPDVPARSYYFLGKDNIFFHTVLWPSILLGHGHLRLPYDVPANEWMQTGGRKISKSRPDDVGAFLTELVEKYPADVIRFYASLLAPQNHDTEFDPAELRQQADEVLANQYGNLVQRVLVLARERAGGRVPVAPTDAAVSREAVERLRRAHEAITSDLEKVHLKEAFDRILTEVREGNRWFHEAKPWQAAEAERSRILYEAIWRLKAYAIWLAPFLPFSSAELFRMLGYDRPPSPGDWAQVLSPVPSGQPLGEVRPLFPRLEASAAAGGGAAAAPSAPPPEGALDIRVGVIASAEPHSSADRLYVLKVDVGEGAARTVVAGLRASYPAEELVGRKVALLANLEPRTIRKITSKGMVLAADAGERAILLRPPPEAPPGTGLAGAVGEPGPLRYDQFERRPLFVGRVLDATDERSRVDLGSRTVEVPGRWSPELEVIVRLDGVDGTTGSILSIEGYGPLDTGARLPPGTKVR